MFTQEVGRPRRSFCSCLRPFHQPISTTQPLTTGAVQYLSQVPSGVWWSRSRSECFPQLQRRRSGHELSPSSTMNYNTLILKYHSTSIRHETALEEAVTHFKSLLSSSTSRSWKPLQPTTSLSYGDSVSLANNKGKTKELLNAIGTVDVPTVQVHRKSGKGADIVRAVTEIAVGDGVDLDSFKAVLRTPEIRNACK